MKTEILTDNVDRAAELVRGGGLVAVPTETVYGLAGNGLDPAAVERIYEVKGRPARKPLSLMVAGADAMAALWAEVPPAAAALAERFWPGPLTLVAKARSGVIPPAVLAGGDTVGLRCPDSEKTLELLRRCGVPLAAPSCNPSGAESPRTAAEVLAYFDGRIDAVIDGGACALGTESTVAGLGENGLAILRQGALPEADIRRCLAGSLKLIGVTGGSGTGKTTALDVLREMGALVIDADAVYHELCESCAPMLEEIDRRFPGAVEDGVLRRKRLGEIVFSDPAALEDLRGITDRYVEREIDRRLSDHAAAGGRYAAVDAINILDTKLMDYGVVTVGVTAPEEARVARLVLREGISEEYARKRIRAQHPAAWFREHCDYTVENDGTMDDYRRRCE
ncbi:MAG: threonylcarbamoyl-AMP synthase, partial [Oscillospiraceae bacterium]|nr:threonylcarbamoyl-AMP synthase [Oscillospiraceae bacterium]